MSDTGTGPSGLDGEQRRRLVRESVAAASSDASLDGLAESLQRVCRAAARTLSQDGAAVHVVTRTGDNGVVAASDARSRDLADLQFAANEGPCFVAAGTHRPVLVPSLDEARDRWPGFVDLAWDQGLRAVFAFPVHEGAVSFGVLELYADRAGPLDPDQQATAAAFARLATEIFIDGNGHGVVTSADLARGVGASMLDRARIYQAQGMVMVDLGISLAEALARMRARAFALDLTLLALADQVIAGALTAESWRAGDGGAT